MSDQRRGGIAWTDETWNPVRGCSRISPGCVNCYAEEMAARFSGPGLAYEGLAHRVGGEARWTGAVRLVPEHLADPLRWTRPRRVFVNSMSDLFHEALSNEHIAAVFGVMAGALDHTFQILTKRAKRMREWFEWYERDRNPGRFRHPELLEHAACVAMGLGHHPTGNRLFKAANEAAGRNMWPLPNVWLGVSVEDQAHADARIPDLLAAPTYCRFVSYEPALGPADFSPWIGCQICSLCSSAQAHPGACRTCGSRVSRRRGLDWVIVGGESGSSARPFDVQWARDVVSQCRQAGAAVFVKQLGTRFAITRPDWGTARRKDRKGGDPAEWPEDLRVQEFPEPRLSTSSQEAGAGSKPDPSLSLPRPVPAPDVDAGVTH